MIPENYKLLIEKLKRKTLEKQTVWNKTSRDTEYKLNLENGAITVDKWVGEDREGALYVDFAIYNDDGDRVDILTFEAQEDKEDYTFLAELYVTVNRAYYKVDETIKNIFKEMESDKKIGKANTPNEKKDELPS